MWCRCSDCYEDRKAYKARVAQKAIDIKEARKKIDARAAREARKNPEKVNRGHGRIGWRKDRREWEDWFGFDGMEDRYYPY